MRSERRMNPKCLGGDFPDTFSAKSAHLTGLKNEPNNSRRFIGFPTPGSRISIADQTRASQQKRPAHVRVRVKLRRAQPEHILPALPPIGTVGRTSQVGSFVP